jgi:hypothetical protein
MIMKPSGAVAHRGMCECPNATAVGEPLSKAREPPLLGAPVVHQAKPAPAGQLHLCRGCQHCLHRVVVSIPADRNHRWADCRQLGEARHVGEVARVDNGIR